ncbi:MAG: CDP-diacylglycerol--glycerol-3-phosphate 3-phosphatidyltransferase [Alphaproteobacteria bacterium]|nr:CDP-diacylglycerol--glycerol-3-phosphate 3-phosphatidyltransferase [Alphaproteobacteria bacterium]HCP01766.1 CDP-diacylglycerol--glycerol-3-phosphate 3-phosphatidyltransferase [Rhodospirillaceae bacterium]
MTIPNVLTLSRIALIPPVVALLWMDDPEMRWWAFGLFAVISLTDWFDGYLARTLDQASKMGALIDPIADKVLVAALIVGLLARGDIAGWDAAGAILILCREFLVSGLREFLAQHDLPLPVTKLAKWKTAVQLIALALLILAPLADPGQLIAISVIWWIATVLTLITGFDYLRSATQHLRSE